MSLEKHEEAADTVYQHIKVWSAFHLIMTFNIAMMHSIAGHTQRVHCRLLYDTCAAYHQMGV